MLTGAFIVEVPSGLKLPGSMIQNGEGLIFRTTGVLKIFREHNYL